MEEGSNLDILIDSFSNLDGIIKTIEQDKLKNYYVIFMTGKGSHGTVFMFNPKGRFILMSTIGQHDDDTLDTFKKRAGIL